MYAVAGYGLTDDDNAESAGVLTEGQSGLDELAGHELAAGDGDPQQACRGDSGGPIFADDSDTYQIGIASRINNADIGGGGPPPCNTGLIYTRIDPYLAWIAEQVPDLGQGGDDGDDGTTTATARTTTATRTATARKMAETTTAAAARWAATPPAPSAARSPCSSSA